MLSLQTVLLVIAVLLILKYFSGSDILIKNEGELPTSPESPNLPESDLNDRNLDMSTYIPQLQQPSTEEQLVANRCKYNLAEKPKHSFQPGFELAERGFEHPSDGITHCESKDSEYYSCGKYDERLTAEDLLPLKQENTWTKVNPSAVTNDLKSHNFLVSKHHFGIDTVGQSLKNANLGLRSEPPNPQHTVSPWLQSSIDNRDHFRRPLELGAQSDNCF
jgi:hypothetical protein